MKAFGVSSIIILCLAFTHSSKLVVMQRNYITLYNDIAVSEMHRSGIPASIKLAQGLLESHAGQSPLAQNANNHFGIKCKSTWTGPVFYKKDDDFDHRGRLTESCFRAYDFVEQSYRDHTDFLVNRPRYQVLFNFGKDDYVNWAIGLQKCGYATDPRYAQKVIETIEKFDLGRFDKAEMPVREKPTNVLLPNYRIPDSYRPGDGLR